MGDGVVSGQTGGFYPVPRRAVTALVAAGVVLGVLGDLLLGPPDPPGLNLSLWIGSVAVAALVLRRRADVPADAERLAWLAVGVVCAAGWAWRDAPQLRLLSLAGATLTFALAAHRTAGSWVRRAGVLAYAGALALGAVHAWMATALAFADARLFFPRAGVTRTAQWRRAAAVARGLLIAAPLVLVFGALFMSADAVFAELVGTVFRFDVEWVTHHLVLFSVTAWIATGYLRGFLTGTELPLSRALSPDAAANTPAGIRPTLGITETATALAVLDLLFLAFVLVQFRYLFGGDTLVQVTPDLTYAEYARHGFFELVFAVVLVVPVLLAADWLFVPRQAREAVMFRSLAGLQIGLVLAIGASAFQRLRLYHDSYGFTEARFYAMVLLIWMGAMLLWLAATVLRGRRESFAFGTLTSGLATLGILFVVNPDAIIARANVSKLQLRDMVAQGHADEGAMATRGNPVGVPARNTAFDVAYATSLSADAVPVLIQAMPTLPPDVQCPLARHMLRRWPPEHTPSIRNWNWSVTQANDAVREHEALLRSMVLPDLKCPAPGTN